MGGVQDPTDGSTVTRGGPAGDDTPPGARRMINILAAVLIGVVVPVAVAWALVGQFGAAAMFTGLLLGGTGAKIGGTRRMGLLAVPTGVVAGLGAFTAYDWWWVALLAIVGFVAGAGIRVGWLPALLMLPYAATFVTPQTSRRDAVVYGVIVGLATVYGVVLARRFGAAEVVDGDRLGRPVAACVAIVFGAILGASAAIGVALDWTEPYWVPEPILILVLYIIMGKRDRIRGKTIGTTLGVAAAIPVALIAPSATIMGVVALVAFVLALTQAKRYWLMYGLYTFALILALATPGQVGSEAEHRGFEILVGIGLLVLGLGAIHALGGSQAKRHPQPEFAPAT
jgi:Fusaric acid resistance protein-like